MYIYIYIYKALENWEALGFISPPNVFETYMIHCNDTYIFVIHITNDKN